MRLSHLAVLSACLSLAGAARADSIIPGNYVDDFGPVTSERSTPGAEGAGRSSPIPGNYVDDFGPLASEDAVPGESRPSRSSPIVGNYIDDFTAPDQSPREKAAPTGTALSAR